MSGPQDLVWQTTIKAAEEAARNATRFLLNDDLIRQTLPLTRLPYQDPYHDLSIEAPSI